MESGSVFLFIIFSLFSGRVGIRLGGLILIWTHLSRDPLFILKDLEATR